MKKFVFLFLGLIVLTACSGEQKMKAGDVVLVDWSDGNWHIAKLSKECQDGWNVDFNDNFYDPSDPKNIVCYGGEKVILNVAPKANKVEVGDTVLAEWVEDAFYAAKIDKIKDDKYSVKFVSDNWEQEVTLDKLRLLPVQKSEK